MTAGHLTRRYTIRFPSLRDFPKRCPDVPLSSPDPPCGSPLSQAQLPRRAQVSEQAQEGLKGREGARRKSPAAAGKMLRKGDDWTGMKNQCMFGGEVAWSSPQALSYQLKHPGHPQLPRRASPLPSRLRGSSSPVWLIALSSSTAAIQLYSRATFPVLDSWKLKSKEKGAGGEESAQ